MYDIIVLTLNFLSDSRDKYSGKAADIWALGVTLYCFIFGKVGVNGVFFFSFFFIFFILFAIIIFTI